MPRLVGRLTSGMQHSSVITEEHRRQYEQSGWFIAEQAISAEHLQILRDACDTLIDSMHQEMDRLGTDHIHISHRGRRYHIAKKHDEVPALRQYIFGDLMADVCRATIGENAFLFYDQYVVKAAEQGSRFSWHQDSGYLDFEHPPYVTVWAAVDDMTIDNGTAWILPTSQLGIRTRVEHIRDENSGDRIGYFGADPGIPAIVPAGSLVVFSSVTFHRSGQNTTDRMRRAYVTQYSPGEIRDPSGELIHLATPFLNQNVNVATNDHF